MGQESSVPPAGPEARSGSAANLNVAGGACLVLAIVLAMRSSVWAPPLILAMIGGGLTLLAQSDLLRRMVGVVVLSGCGLLLTLTVTGRLPSGNLGPPGTGAGGGVTATRDSALEADAVISSYQLAQVNGISVVSGTLENKSGSRLLAVMVRFDLEDASGRSLGTADDIIPELAPGAEVSFRARGLGGATRAVARPVASVRASY